MKKIILKNNHSKRVLEGHQWLFSNEINHPTEDSIAGEIVSVFTNNNHFIGYGFYNKNSLISIRIITRDENTVIGINFFRERILQADELRKKIFHNRKSYRMVFGESDFLPGLIIDKFNDSFSIQIHSAGMDNFQDLIKEILINDFSAKNIILRNDFNSRELEGLKKFKEIIHGVNHTEIIDDGIIKYHIDLLNGQKTGSFFDQVENRHSIINISKGLNVLDCFCNTGGFSLASLYGGADKVTAVDISNEAIEIFKTNLKLNDFQNKNVSLICDDVFNFLKLQKKNDIKFDLIILDPPSFTKSKKNIKEALNGYFTINSLAMELLNENGFLATSSCSHHVDESTFLDIVSTAAKKRNKVFQILKSTTAASDHPIHSNMLETKYLKYMLIKLKSIK